jgi:pimeloyl-ACP methyl ester carboxylesterase
MRSWTPQAETINAAGYTVVSIQNAGPKSLQITLADLRQRCAVRTVSVVGASIGGQIASNALRDDPAAFDRIILLSSDVDVSLLADMPKLFVASEGEGMSFDPSADAAESMGDDDTAVSYPGTAHAQDISPRSTARRCSR